MSKRLNKRALQVASAIESEITRRGWPIGESLGSEPALIEHFGVSRAVMREAIRIVESHGVARMQLGPGGGLTVTEPEPDVVADSAALLLDFAGVRPRDLFEARNAVELEAVRLAAERIDADGVTRLREMVSSEAASAEGEQERAIHPMRLHLELARASGNPALVLLTDMLNRLMAQRYPQSAAASGDRDQIRSAHAAIVAAIVAGDSAMAQHLLRRHLASSIGQENDLRDDVLDPYTNR